MNDEENEYSISELLLFCIMSPDGAVLRRPKGPDFCVVLANPTPGKCSTMSPAAKRPASGNFND